MFDFASMSCQICHLKYDLVRVPYVLQPCGHGLCKFCVEEYITVRGSSTCPSCRTNIETYTVNYDLKDLCSAPVEGWRQKFLECLALKKKDIHITVDDSILAAVPLIMCKLEGKRDTLHEAMITLVRHSSADDVYRWVDILEFPESWELELKVGKLIRQHEFLDKKKASWLLEFL